MLGNAKGDGPGGFLLLERQVRVAGRWEKDATGMNFNYDFWYQPRHNVMVSSEWAAPNTFRPGFNFDDVKAGKYGQQHSLLGLEGAEDRAERSTSATGLIPLEVRFHHDPDRTHGFVGAALSSAMWHWHAKSRRVARREGRSKSNRSRTTSCSAFPVPG